MSESRPPSGLGRRVDERVVDPVDDTSAVVLVLDTATTKLVVGLARPDGDLLTVLGEPSGYRHGELLLPLVDQALAAARRRTSDLAGVVVGTGPGAFTGLRVGLATAAGIARALACPLVGVPTSEAIIATAAEAAACDPSSVVLLLPAGPTDRVVARAGQRAVLLPGGREPELGRGEVLVAVDLPGRAPVEALERGAAATEPERLARAFLRVGLPLLSSARARPATTPEPEYVTPPRGLAAVVGEVRLVGA